MGIRVPPESFVFPAEKCHRYVSCILVPSSNGKVGYSLYGHAMKNNFAGTGEMSALPRGETFCSTKKRSACYRTKNPFSSLPPWILESPL